MTKLRNIGALLLAVAVFVFSSGLSVTAHTCLRSGEMHSEFFALSDHCTGHDEAPEPVLPCCRNAAPVVQASCCAAKPAESSPTQEKGHRHTDHDQKNYGQDSKCCDSETHLFQITTAAHLTKDVVKDAVKAPVAPLVFLWLSSGRIEAYAELSTPFATNPTLSPPGRSLVMQHQNFRL